MLLSLFFPLSLATQSSSAFVVPQISAPVMDQAHILSADTISRLDTYLSELSNNDIVQLQVLTLPSLHDLPIEQVSIQITDTWKLGEKKKDNGVLFLIVPSDHKMRIEVGRGLEGEIPDITAKRIIADIVTPYFKQNEFDAGVIAGVKAIVHAAAPNLGASAGAAPISSGKEVPGWLVFLILGFVLLTLLFGGRGGGPRIWMGGGGFGGGFGGGSGGWSGGGGGFNGGGASGSW